MGPGSCAVSPGINGQCNNAALSRKAHSMAAADTTVGCGPPRTALGAAPRPGSCRAGGRGAGPARCGRLRHHRPSPGRVGSGAGSRGRAELCRLLQARLASLPRGRGRDDFEPSGRLMVSLRLRELSDLEGRRSRRSRTHSRFPARAWPSCSWWRGQTSRRQTS